VGQRASSTREAIRPAPRRRRWRSPLLRPLMRAQQRLRRGLALARASVVDWAFHQRLIASLLRRQHVLCLGDSHVEVMAHVRVPGVWFRAKAVPGATASGVQNPQSTSQAAAIFDALLARAKPWHEILLHLGEVDCGFLIWRRAQRLGVAVEQQLTYTLDNYESFVSKVVQRGFKRVMVLSAPLPTIGDDPAKWGEIASLRRTVIASRAERTALTVRFNAGLRDRCEAIGVPFVDATTGHRDPGTGLIDPSFLRTTHQDHHLADGPYSRLIARELGRLWG
jgi:hypothetical protein